jgi:hypothetical protein
MIKNGFTEEKQAEKIQFSQMKWKRNIRRVLHLFTVRINIFKLNRISVDMNF